MANLREISQFLDYLHTVGYGKADDKELGYLTRADLAVCRELGHVWDSWTGYRDCKRCGSEHELVNGVWIVRAGIE